MLVKFLSIASSLPLLSLFIGRYGVTIGEFKCDMGQLRLIFKRLPSSVYQLCHLIWVSILVYLCAIGRCCSCWCCTDGCCNNGCSPSAVSLDYDIDVSPIVLAKLRLLRLYEVIRLYNGVCIAVEIRGARAVSALDVPLVSCVRGEASAGWRDATG